MTVLPSTWSLRSLLPALLLGCLFTSPAVAQNLLSNPELDVAMAPWSTGAQELIEQAWRALDVDDSPGSGSLEVHAWTGSSYQCVPVVGHDEYLLTGFVAPRSLDRGGNVAHSIEIEWFATASCGGFVSLYRDALVSPGTLDVWHEVAGLFVAPPTARSARVHLQNRSTGGLARALFDSVYVPEPGFSSSALAGVMTLALVGGAGRQPTRRSRSPRAMR